MASSKMLLMILMLALLLIDSTKADSSSSPDPHKRKTPVERDARIMYHLLEGRKHKQDHATYNNNHEPGEGKKHTFVTPLPLPKDYANKPKTEGFRHVTVIPNHNYPSSYGTDHQTHSQSTTITPYYVPLPTPPPYTTHKPYRKPSHCACNPKSNYKTLSTTLKQHMPALPYAPEHVSQATPYDERTHHGRKAPYKKKSSIACGDRKLRKIKHVIIKKTDSPRDKKYMDETAVEAY